MGEEVNLGRWGPERGMDTPLVISIKDLWGLSPAQKVGGGGGVVSAGAALGFIEPHGSCTALTEVSVWL